MCSVVVGVFRSSFLVEEVYFFALVGCVCFRLWEKFSMQARYVSLVQRGYLGDATFDLLHII